MSKPFCVAPFAEGFSGIDTPFRNCCVADPQINSHPDQTFEQWWNDSRLTAFRQSLTTDQWPDECYRCKAQENKTGRSFRTALNSSVRIDDNFGKWPSRWNLKFGNICNLACWICSEHSSSVIVQHKQRVGLLPPTFIDPEEKFQAQWSTLKIDVLKSYEYHEVVTLTLLGGEPLYNKTVIKFLNELKSLGLASRTKLEFHTNGTKFNQELFVDGSWNYICVFISLDAVGHKAEWLRYGCKWKEVEHNVDQFIKTANYTEVHCILSILNVNDLYDLKEFCNRKNLKLVTTLLASPDYMSLKNWPGDKDLIVDRDSEYYALIGSTPDNTAMHKLKSYISQFSEIRRNLRDFDPKLAHALGLDQ